MTLCNPHKLYHILTTTSVCSHYIRALYQLHPGTLSTTYSHFIHYIRELYQLHPGTYQLNTVTLSATYGHFSHYIRELYQLHTGTLSATYGHFINYIRTNYLNVWNHRHIVRLPQPRYRGAITGVLSNQARATTPRSSNPLVTLTTVLNTLSKITGMSCCETVAKKPEGWEEKEREYWRR